MKEWFLAHWWMIWMIWMVIVALAFVGHRLRQRESRDPDREFQKRTSNQVVLRQLVIVSFGLVFVAIALLLVRLL